MAWNEGRAARVGADGRRVSEQVWKGVRVCGCAGEGKGCVCGRRRVRGERVGRGGIGEQV
eukprot:97125-Chlamydomonas_euryale.AAC.2